MNYCKNCHKIIDNDISFEFCTKKCKTEYIDKAFKDFEDMYPIESRFDILDL